jgi:two-component system, LuxR family, sensor kinase FixL
MDADSPGNELLDALPDPIIGVDAQWRIVEWNRAAAAAYGFSRAEAIGRPAPELLRTRFPAPLAEIRETLADTGGWEGAVVHLDRHGREVAADSRWSARRDGGGSAVGALWIDRERATELPEADRAAPPPRSAHPLDRLGLIASGVAHDFNNLLAVIVSYSMLVRNELDSAHRSTGDERWALLSRDIGEIRLAAERATQLSRRLLAAVRGEDADADSYGLIGAPGDEPCSTPRGCA